MSSTPGARPRPPIRRRAFGAFYGIEADPLRTQVTGEAVHFDGQPVWCLDTEFAVTVDDERRTHTWTEKAERLRPTTPSSLPRPLRL